jgi:putative intracellular protease/amidase
VVRVEPRHRWGSPSSRLVLQAVLDVLVDHGYDAVTPEAVAQRAGVAGPPLGEQPDTEELVATALTSIELYRAPEPTGSLQGDLRRLVQPWRNRRTTDEMAVAAVLSGAEWHPRLKAAVTRSLDRPLAQAIGTVLNRAAGQDVPQPALQTLGWVLRGLALERLRTGSRSVVDLDHLVGFVLAGTAHQGGGRSAGRSRQERAGRWPGNPSRPAAGGARLPGAARSREDPMSPTPLTTRTTRVGLLLFDEVEVLDACGPFEVFSVATRVAARDRPGTPPPFEVITLSAGPTTTVRARGGLAIVADRLVADAPQVDVALVPGGVTTGIEGDAAVLAWIRAAALSADVVASVCTGAFPLARAGLLDGLTATTHWEDRAQLRDRFPAVTVLDDARYVDHGRVATSAGVSAGIDLALHLVSTRTDEQLAVATARQMDHPWTRA